MYGNSIDKIYAKTRIKIICLVRALLVLDPEAESEAGQRAEVVGASCYDVAYPEKTSY